MAKPTFLFAAVAVFLLVSAANASIYRTTVVVEDEEGNPRGQSCQEQIRRQQLRGCQMLLRSQCEQQRERREPPYYRGSEEDDNQARQLQECCRQLEQIPQRCRCEALEQAVRITAQGQQGRQTERVGERQLYDMARRVPSMCQIHPTQCDFGGSRWWY